MHSVDEILGKVEQPFKDVLGSFNELHLHQDLRGFMNAIQESLPSVEEAVKCFDCIFGNAMVDESSKKSFVVLVDTLRASSIQIGDLRITGQVQDGSENAMHTDVSIVYSVKALCYAHTLRISKDLDASIIGASVTYL